ncbi:MAG: uracil-DNA glycosylase [Pelagibacterales bacterium]|nr:uracil-DNA glycosylase [Pelagibacterales bacterium]
MTKNSVTEILQFYLDNGLDEVVAEKSQNHFLIKDKQKNSEIKVKQEIKKVENIVVKKEENKVTNDFLKPVSSTFEAISTLANLAKKQNSTIDKVIPNSSNQQLISLNEIVAQAKAAAAEAQNLSELRKAVENFEGCNLKKMATNTVFCDGNPNSKIMVIGEAPGNHEDLQGIPFCGDSGKVLDAMFSAINMTRAENFYITNVIFWRPPGNRRPTDEELAICRPFVERHIQLLNPEVIVLVGATSMSAVVGINDPISGVRGKFMDFAPSFLSKTIKTFAIFHPSYLMRQSSKKKLAWLDMLALEQYLQKLK